MLLIRITALSAVLSLAACSGSNNGPLSTDTDNGYDNTSTTGPIGETPTPGVDQPGTGSITLNTSPTITLEPLPDTTYEPGEDAANSVDSVTSSVSIDGGTAASDADSTDAGATDAGTSDAGSIEASPGAVAPEASDTISTDTALPPATTLPSPSPPEPDFQSGSLTAADYDDQLNPHLYQQYASDYLQRVGGKLDVPYLDLSKRIALHVTDESDRRYGGTRIDISGANGQILSLKVPNSGVTYIYRDVDELPDQFTIRATGRYGAAIDKTIDLTQVGSGPVDINIVIPENAAPADVTQPAAALDIMFVVDTTGSMGDELSYLQTELSSIINALPFNNGGTNLGLTFYRDEGDDYVVRTHDFNDDIASVQRTLNNETYNGGGDFPEAMDQALRQAIDASWQQDSRKVLFLIADAPPHDDRMRATWEAAEDARAKNIHIVPVAASGVGEDAEYLMRSIAAYTNSRYLFLTDDSGYGNSHAEPDVDCYVVTQLNNLMIRVLNSLISGVRQEPTDNEIIRTVGNYNEGVCEPMLTIQ